MALTNPSAISDRATNKLYSVRDYGAKGDNSTDDTAAIQATINLGGVTLFPPGQYRISSLTVPLGAVLRGWNGTGYGVLLSEALHSTLVRIAGTNAHMLVGATGAAHVRIEHLHLDGNKNNNASGDGIHLNDAGVSEEGQWRIDNCFVEANPGYGVYIGTFRRAVDIEATDVVGNALSGIRVNGSDTHITRCIVGSNAGDGIQVGGIVTRITDCDIYGNGTAADATKGNGVNILTTITQVMLKGNGIDRNLTHGINVATACDAIAIIGNDLHSNSQDANAAAHHINVLTLTGGVNLVGNVFGGIDSGITKLPNYCINLAAGATALEVGSISVASGSVLGLTNDPYRLRTPASFQGLPSFFRSGLYYAAAVANSTGTLSNGNLRLAPLNVPRAATIDRIGCEVTVAGDAGSTLRLGIYKDDGTGYPGALLLDAGTVTADATGVKEIVISQALGPGVYWIGMATQGVTVTAPTVRLLNESNAFIGVTTAANASSGFQYCYTQGSVTGALPATFTATPGTSGTAPKVFVRVV